MRPRLTFSTLLATAALLVAGCSGTENPTGQPPSNLTYSANPAIYVTGKAITPNAPTLNGNATEFSVAPPIPVGLTFDTLTGVISGTPTQATGTADYIVTARNSRGYTTASLTMTVADPPPPPPPPPPPRGLVYSANPATYTVGRPITPNVPYVTGGTVETYAVAPSLPQGIVLDTATGVISGTPAVLAPAVAYTVTGSNASGTTASVLTIAVEEPLLPPANLVYGSLSASYTSGLAIPPNTPASSGGPVEMYSVTPVTCPPKTGRVEA
ncbi:putative Ig domain-containing protein [Anaeromyxobacter sp. SG66]|uniref:putative Ig domain-containing protein n=1 Tax=Anaeromyxobacter sp. SG66 TaxID=2925410 RepID=UPI0035ABFC95